jgi:Tfp pilus assembly protein PilV
LIGIPNLRSASILLLLRLLNDASISDTRDPARAAAHFMNTGLMRPNLARNRSAFTLVEAMIALALTVMIGTGIIAAMLQANRNAYVTRNQTGAQELCEGKIDEIISASYPASGTVPTVLTSGTTTESVKVYIEQNNTTVDVPGTRTTTIATADATLKLLQVTVTVTYNFRGRPYSYQACTLRAPD